MHAAWLGVVMHAAWLGVVGMASATPTHARPALVTSLSSPTDVVHYFAIGSNMLRSKLEGRGPNGAARTRACAGASLNPALSRAGTTISLIDFRPAVVRAHRLAFNMRGFPPLEPAMGALEPSAGAECHGALCTLTAAEYEKVWQSEGGAQPKPGYEEIVVDAVPYGSTEPVRAVALRAREHVRLPTDASPSSRYMRMLIDGAAELGIDAAYVEALRSTPTQTTGPLLRWLALHQFYVTMLSFRLKMRWATRALSAALWRAYVPPTHASAARRGVGAASTSLLLLPGALIGALIRLAMWAARMPPPPMLAVMTAKPRKATPIKTTTTTTTPIAQSA